MFCRECGAFMDDSQTVCPACGAEYPEAYLFCPKDGTRQDKAKQPESDGREPAASVPKWPEIPMDGINVKLTALDKDNRHQSYFGPDRKKYPGSGAFVPRNGGIQQHSHRTAKNADFSVVLLLKYNLGYVKYKKWNSRFPLFELLSSMVVAKKQTPLLRIGWHNIWEASSLL